MILFPSAVLFALATGVFDDKKRRKRKIANQKDGEPQAKKLKRTEPSSSSSDADDNSSDSNSSFDIFSSLSGSDSEESSYGEDSNSDDGFTSDSDNEPSLDDISIKEEPLRDFDGEIHPEHEIVNKDDSRAVDSTSSSKADIVVKTEVLDSIVDGVEVDRRTLLVNSEVPVKDEPTDIPSTIAIPIEVKDEPNENGVVGSSSDASQATAN